jgi:sRNA-binding carbon storage regulator CsrA
LAVCGDRKKDRVAAIISLPAASADYWRVRCNVGRLVLRRRSGESLTIGDNINIEVVSAHGDSHEMCAVRFNIGEDIRVDVTKEGRHIRFTIEAPESVTILRDELTKRPAAASAGNSRAKP